MNHLNGNPNPSPLPGVQSNMFFGSPNFTMSPQGKFVQRLCQVEAENKLLRTELDELKRWKTGLESWLVDAFGLVPSEFKVGGDDDTESVSSNNSRNTNTRPTDETISGNVNYGVVKMEVEDNEADTTGANENTDSLNATQPLVLNLPAREPQNLGNSIDNGHQNGQIREEHSSTKECPDSIHQVSSQLHQNKTCSPSPSSSSTLSNKTISVSSGSSTEDGAPRIAGSPGTRRVSGLDTASLPVRRVREVTHPPLPLHHSEETVLAKVSRQLVPLRRRIIPKKVDVAPGKPVPPDVVTIEDEETVSIPKLPESTVEDVDPTPCDVCRGSLPEVQNNMIYCEKCNICVHQACYGVSEIPEDEWVCQPCAAKIPVEEQTCRFCTIKGGAMVRVKSPKNNTWAHVSCCWWIPGIHIHDPTIMDMVVGTPNIEKGRYNLFCSLCKKGKGTTCCIQCRYRRCATAFHVTCAFKAGLRMEMVDDDEAPGGVLLISFCNAHRDTDLATVNQQTPRSSPQKKKRKTEGPPMITK